MDRVKASRGPVTAPRMGRLFFALCLLFLPAGPAGANYGGGSGTAEDPYLIHTAEQMNTIGLRQEDWDKQFKLMADIDLSTYPGDSFNLIGNFVLSSEGASSLPFTGVFDGNGHVISNFTYLVDASQPSRLPGLNRYEIGLFRLVKAPGQIKNLGLIDPVVEPATTCAGRVTDTGALVGWLEEGPLTDCYVEGGWIAADADVGGLVGSNHGGTISRCYTTCNLAYAGQYVSRPELTTPHPYPQCFGGLAGSNTGEIHDSYATGTVLGAGYVGGLVGYNQGGTAGATLLSNCFATGRISGDEMVGGLVGENTGGTIQRSCAIGSVSGNGAVGGLVGDLGNRSPNRDSQGNILPGESWSFGVVKDCYATGPVSGLVSSTFRPSTREGIGGLIGYLSGRVLNCYTTGAVSGKKGSIGGLAGDGNERDVFYSFWNTETAGCTESIGGVAATTAEMQDPATYLMAGWDFVGETANGTEDIWTMDSNQPGYPRLVWEQTIAGGIANPVGAGTRQAATIYQTTLDTDPGWTTEGQWQFGRPAGLGGENGYPDPNSGQTGANVYGVNLDGDYQVLANGPHYLTAGPFDCRRYQHVTLQFARWLNTDQADFVSATLEVSPDGVPWTTLWAYSDTEAELTENTWTTVAYDIGEIAGGQRQVYLRWGYEIKAADAWAFAGWNIDDIVLIGH